MVLGIGGEQRTAFSPGKAAASKGTRKAIRVREAERASNASGPGLTAGRHLETVSKMIILLLLSLSFSPSLAQVQSHSQWRPATYRGLIVGKSRRPDMLRKLGQPKWSRSSPGEAEPESEREDWNNYERVGEFPGITNVVVDKSSGRINRIEFYPEKLSKEQAIARFGPNYVITKYDFDPCSEDEESEPIYESPNGPLTVVEYRARGIAISVGYKDMVTRISYVAGPIGSSKAKCK